VFDVPEPLRRLADQIDGWLDLRCPEKALALLEPMLANAAGRPAALVFRVRANIRLGNYREALGDLGELRQLDSTNEWVDLTEGWCRKRTGDLPGAIRCLEQLTRRDGRHAFARFNLACYLALAGQIDRAIDELTMACGLDEECRDHARDEPDFDRLRTDQRFRELIRKARPAGAAPRARDAAPPLDLGDDPLNDEDDDLPGPPPGAHRRN
jgi:tetratricopeptide (TPR) repeat protein